MGSIILRKKRKQTKMSSAAMENFVMNVRTLSSQGNFTELNEFLQKNMEILVRNPAHLGNVLETLDIQQHSLGVLAVMSAKLQQSEINDWEDLFNRLTIFIMECNGEQIRYAAQSFAELCHLFAEQLIKKNTPLVGLSPLLKAICKIQLSEKCLTSVHADVARLALASKCFTRPVLSLLEVNFNEISKEATANPKNVLLFFYYGGMISASIKKYSRALYMLEAVVTMPAVAVSHIMLEAYKKYLLIWLIINGDRSQDALTFPKYTSPVVSKYIRPLCAAYQDVVKAFYATQHSELNSVLEKHQVVFAEDGNAGLVAQVVVARQKTSIKRLTKTFLTLSLEDVASRVGMNSPAEAERQLVSMIEEGSIFARISQKDGMVRFDTNPEKYNSVKMLRKLETDVENLVTLDSHIAAMEEEIMINPKYIKICGSLSVRGGHGGPDLDDEALGNAMPSSARGSRSGSLGPSSSSGVNSNNINFTC